MSLIFLTLKLSLLHERKRHHRNFIKVSHHLERDIFLQLRWSDQVSSAHRSKIVKMAGLFKIHTTNRSFHSIIYSIVILIRNDLQRIIIERCQLAIMIKEPLIALSKIYLARLCFRSHLLNQFRRRSLGLKSKSANIKILCQLLN